MLSVDRRVVALASARAADAFGNSFLIVVLPIYIASDAVSGGLFGLQEAAVIGIVLSTLGFVNSGLQPFTGRLSDRLGRRRVLVLAGLGLLAVSNLAFLWATGYGQLLAIRASQGIALALAIPCTLALVSEFSLTTNRGESMGVYNTLRLLGYGVGPILAGFLLDQGPYPLPGTEIAVSGFQAAFLVASLAALAAAGLVAVFVHDPEELTATASDDLSVKVFARDGDGLDPVFVLAVATLVSAVSISLIASIENEINTRLGQSATWFGLQFSAFLVPHVLFQTPVGRLSDRRGRLPFVVGGLALAVPTTLVQGYVTGPWQMLGARALQGLATVLFFAPGLAMAGDLSRTGTSGTNLGTLTAAFGFGVAAGPLLAGFLVAFGFAVPFAVGALLVGVAALLAWSQLDETAEPASQPPPEPADA